MKSTNLLILLFTLIHTKNALKTENLIGGVLAKFGDCAYQVLIKLDNKYCGGALLSSQFVVTAAHCVVEGKTGEFFAGPVEVIAGTVDLKSYPSTRVKSYVDKIYVPAEYPMISIFPTPGDIAVLRLKDPFNLENNVGLSKVEIPPNTPFYNDLSSITATISGFGVDLLRFKPYRDNENKVVFDGYQSKKLHYAKTTILPDALCHMLTKVYLPNQQICAQMHQMSSTPEGTCRGDSGGPLVYQNKYIIGVLSSGSYDCDEVTNAAIFTATAYYRNFFNKAFNDDCNRITCAFYG